MTEASFFLGFACSMLTPSKIMDAARGFSAAFCARAAELVMETDYRMKTSYDDSERLLELLVLQLAQEAGHG